MRFPVYLPHLYHSSTIYNDIESSVTSHQTHPQLYIPFRMSCEATDGEEDEYIDLLKLKSLLIKYKDKREFPERLCKPITNWLKRTVGPALKVLAEKDLLKDYAFLETVLIRVALSMADIHWTTQPHLHEYLGGAYIFLLDCKTMITSVEANMEPEVHTFKLKKSTLQKVLLYYSIYLERQSKHNINISSNLLELEKLKQDF